MPSIKPFHLAMYLLLVAAVITNFYSQRFKIQLGQLITVMDAATAQQDVAHVFRRELYQYQPPEERTAEQRAQARDECGAFPYSKFFQQQSKVRSRAQEDLTIYHTFFRNSTKPLRYIEMGGFDGLTESNTRFYDVCLEWDGLLVEANPLMYPKMVANRPHAHRISYAASCSEEDAANNKTVAFHDYTFTNAAQEITKNSYTGKRTVDVTCGSLEPTILQLWPDGHVHFFSLNVEGAEPMVVGNINFDKVYIDIVIIENTNEHCKAVCPARDEFRATMKGAGYKRWNRVVRFSDLFIHSKSPYLSMMTTSPDENES